MRKTFAVVLMLAMAVAAIPARLFAAVKAGARQQGGTLTGTAHGASKQTLPNYTVHVRNVADGQIAGTTTSSQTGTFAFQGLPAGSYVVEIVDATGKVVGLSPAISVAAGASVSVAVSVAVTASAAGAIAGAAGGGFGLFGLGTAASVAVVSAAGAAAVVAVTATSSDASPSK